MNNVFPRHEQVLEHRQGFMAAEVLVADVDIAAFILRVSQDCRP